MTAALAVALVAAASTACAERGDAPTVEPLPPPQQLRGEVGDPQAVGDVEVTVLSIDAFDRSPEGFPRLQVAVRSENTTFGPVRNPDAELVCDEVPVGGEWWNGSTWEANSLLGPGEVNEGLVYVGFPSLADRPEYPVPTCTNARAVLTATDVTDRSETQLVYPVEAEVIDAAIDALLGNPLPLPPAPGGPVGIPPGDERDGADG